MKYKSAFNDFKNQWISCQPNDNEQMTQYEEYIKILNEYTGDIDENMLDLVIDVLENIDDITVLNIDVIQRVVELRNVKYIISDENINILSKILEIFHYISTSEDMILKSYLYTNFHTFIFDIINNINYVEIIVNGIDCLDNIIDEKIETCKLIDGTNFLHASLYILDKISNNQNTFRYNCPSELKNNYEGFLMYKESEMNNLIHSCFGLLSNCISFFAYSNYMKEEVKEFILDYFNSNSISSKTAAANALNRISYFQIGITETFFKDFEFFESLFNFIWRNPKIVPFADYVFGFMNNLSIKSSEIASFIGCNTKFFEIIPSDNWENNTIINYFKLLDTIVSQCLNEVNSYSLLEKIIDKIDSFIDIISNFLNYGNFKVRVNICFVICKYIELSNRVIIEKFFKEIPILEIFEDFLQFQNIKLINEVLKSLIRLCNFSPINNINIVKELNSFNIQSISENIINLINEQNDKVIGTEIYDKLNQISKFINE